MNKYYHLSLEEREKLYAWRESGVSLRKIAEKLRRNVGTISRELKRHTRYGKAYLPCLAHRRAEIWAARQRYQAPLKNPKVFLYVRQHLREPYHWSPETIAGRLSIDHPEESIHHETIYRYIYNSKKTRGMKLWRYLKLHRKRRMKHDGRKVKQYARLRTAIPIDKRPEKVNNRQEPGHWETDNMEGLRSDKSSVSVTVDRMTRISRIRKLVDHTSYTKNQVLLEQNRQDVFKTLTVDRGPENSRHEEFAKETKAPVYACNPYHSWEKGTVENTIGRIREFIPKKTSIDPIPDWYFIALEEKMNSTPRKVLGFLTPNEFEEKIRSASRTR
jgi:IS30 family transposase